MKETTGITNENRTYWSQRSATYSDVNKEELATSSRDKWKAAIRHQIGSHCPGRSAETIHVLDVGTGPGFFAIILSELGYRVTAIDLTPNMLSEAKQNAGLLADKIEFIEMNAEALSFPDKTFDVVISRNLTWNLPHPETAYSEWCRVLKDDGLLINFDSNWYSYLFDGDALEAYASDRANSEALGLGDQNVGENFDVMEDIAQRLPLSGISRPAWDIEVLSGLGYTVKTDTDIWKTVWSRQEQVNFSSTPMFMITASRALP